MLQGAVGLGAVGAVVTTSLSGFIREIVHTETSPMHVCRAIALDLLPNYEPVLVVIYRFDGSNLLLPDGHFGNLPPGEEPLLITDSRSENLPQKAFWLQEPVEANLRSLNTKISDNQERRLRSFAYAYPLSRNGVLYFETLKSVPNSVLVGDFFNCVALLVEREIWPWSRNTAARYPNEEKEMNLQVQLTERQQQIAQHILDGATNSSIAKMIGYSASLVGQETVRIFRALGVKNRTELRTRLGASEFTSRRQ